MTLSEVKPPQGQQKDDVRDLVLKDFSEALLEVSLWGATFAGVTWQPNDVVLIENAKLRPGKQEGRARLSCEFWEDSPYGHALFLHQPTGPKAESMKKDLDITGGHRISDDAPVTAFTQVPAEGDAMPITVAGLRAFRMKDTQMEAPKPASMR